MQIRGRRRSQSHSKKCLRRIQYDLLLAICPRAWMIAVAPCFFACSDYFDACLPLAFAVSPLSKQRDGVTLLTVETIEIMEHRSYLSEDRCAVASYRIWWCEWYQFAPPR